MAESEGTETEGKESEKLVTQVVSLWTFLFSRLITAGITILIVWLIAGDFFSSLITRWALGLASKTELLDSLEKIGLKDKVWILVLFGFLSILHINASFASAITQVVPIQLGFAPLLRPTRRMVNLLANLWVLKPEIKIYYHLQEYVEIEIRRVLQKKNPFDEPTYYAQVGGKAQRANTRARTSIYFSLFSGVFYLVSYKFGWLNPLAKFNLLLILFVCSGFSFIQFLQYAILWNEMYASFIDDLILQARSVGDKIIWPEVHMGEVSSKEDHIRSTPGYKLGRSWKFITGVATLDIVMSELRYAFIQGVFDRRLRHTEPQEDLPTFERSPDR